MFGVVFSFISFFLYLDKGDITGDIGDYLKEEYNITENFIDFKMTYLEVSENKNIDNSILMDYEIIYLTKTQLLKLIPKRLWDRIEFEQSKYLKLYYIPTINDSVLRENSVLFELKKIKPIIVITPKFQIIVRNRILVLLVLIFLVSLYFVEEIFLVMDYLNYY